MAHHDASHAVGAGAGHHGTADDEYAFTPPGAGHEHTDASVGLILKFTVWLVVVALLVHVGAKVMFDVMVSQREEAADTLEFPLAGSRTETRLPAAPRLQRSPANEIYEFRLKEREAVTTYGWVDRNAGTVRIPVAEAMRLTVERGLPARAQTPAEGSTSASVEVPGLIPADASAGRVMERRRQ